MPRFRSLLRSASSATLTLGLTAAVGAQAAAGTPYYFSTLAGTAAHGATDGPGAVARFYNPAGIALAPDGNAYVTDAGNNTIRRITPAGIVSTLAGSPGTKGNADGRGAAARFDTPWAITIDLTGKLFVHDTGNNAIRKITPQGEVTTIVAPADREVTEIDLHLAAGRLPAALASAKIPMDLNGYYFYPDNNGGRYETGDLDPAFGYQPPPTLALDAAGNVYSANDATIYKTTPGGVTSALAGSPHGYGSADGVGVHATFSSNLSLATDLLGTVYVAEREQGTIRTISANGTVTTVAGLADNWRGSRDKPVDGDRATARFAAPSALAVNPAGHILVADETAIRVATPAGSVSTLAGLSANTARGDADGTGSAARFGAPLALALAPDGNLYVSDWLNHTIRRVSPTGTVTTIAGLAGSTGTSDGVGSAARFLFPESIAVDRSGTVYVADNFAVRKISSTGAVTTLAGRPGVSGTTDGTGGDARFQSIYALAVDAAGTIYAKCYSGPDLVYTLRRITPGGTVTTLGTAPGANLATDQAGRLYTCLDGPKIARIADDGTQAVILDLSSSWVIDPGPTGYNDRSFGDFAFDAEGNVLAVHPHGLLRKIAPTGAVTEIGGAWSRPSGSFPPVVSPLDGLGALARFETPGELVVSPTGTVYLADGSTVRQGQPAGPVTITAQPQSQSVTAGTRAQFSVTATGVPAPTYQWSRNGTPISGATAATLSIPSVTSADAGDYTVVATNALGPVTSSTATLTVTTAPTAPATPSSGGGALGGAFVLALVALAAAALARGTPGKPGAH